MVDSTLVVSFRVPFFSTFVPCPSDFTVSSPLFLSRSLPFSLQ